MTDVIATVVAPAADNGANTGDTALVPPAMTAGDAVLIIVNYRDSVAAISMKAGDGQSWTAGPKNEFSNRTTIVFSCIWDGNWLANPEVDVPGVLTTTVVMLVIDDVDPDTLYDIAEDAGFLGAATTQTLPAATTLTDGALALAIIHSRDNNTWGADAVNGWDDALGLPGAAGHFVRNSGGGDNSIAIMKKLMPAAGDTLAAESVQLTLGADAGAYHVIIIRPAPAFVGLLVAEVGFGNAFFDGEQRVAIRGSGYTAVAGKVYLNSTDSKDGNQVEQTVRSWAAGQIVFDVAMGALIDGDLFVLVELSDGFSFSASEVLSVQPNPNGIPQIYKPLPELEIVLAVPVNVDYGAYFYDSDSQEQLIYTDDGATLPGWASISPSGELVGSPGGGDVATTAVTIRGTDPDGSFAEDTFNIEVVASAIGTPMSLAALSTSLHHLPW